MYVVHFERTAAEIADNAVRLIKARDHAQRGKLGLALAGDAIDLGAADALRLENESLSILGVAARRRGEHPQFVDFHAVAERAEAAQRRERLLDGVGRQQARRMHFAPEP